MTAAAKSTALPQHTPPISAQTWRPLRLFNAYRLVLGVIFVAIGFSELELKSNIGFQTHLYAATALAYLLINTVNAVTIARRWPAYHTQLYSQLILDLIALTLILHASGSIDSGVGLLILFSVAGGSILTGSHGAIALAAAATLLTLTEHSYFNIAQPSASAAYMHAGLLGASYFATAIAANSLAKQIRASEALAQQKSADLANMEKLAQYVIRQMQTGVIVTDRQSRTWLVNDSARHLLSQPDLPPQTSLDNLSPALADQHTRWRTAHSHSPEPIETAGNNQVLPHFARLGDNVGTLIFLEDLSSTAQQAQQLKLASLGRLAGSIAHEIRNPLSAIRHAGQLLDESANLDPTDRRLTEIIRLNCDRMNHIIESVLQLGRRRESHPEACQLKPWLDRFIAEFRQHEQLAPETIQVSLEPANIEVTFDPDQLRQVLWNLCHNGVRHSLTTGQPPRLRLLASVKPDTPLPVLDVIDNGPGIPPDLHAHIFEPFFTTDAKGTGLGLYIAKELSEYNHARLSFIPTPTGACFRLTFADPRRQRAA